MRWSRSAISMTALINWMAMGAGSFFWGVLSDRVGSRAVTVAGGSLLGLGLVLFRSGDSALAAPRDVRPGCGVRSGSVPDTALRDGDEVVHGQPRSRRGASCPAGGAPACS